MMTTLSSVARVDLALREADVDANIQTLDASTRTASEAAAAIGCTVAQIAKSLIFRGADTGFSILVIASGTNRVDEEKIAVVVGEKVSRASAEFVREMTGYVIGGVPPLAHATPPRWVLVDNDLAQYESVWAAAGTPHSVVCLTPAALLKVSKGRVADIKH